jgi:CheY-like chemotaxis protein
MRADAAGALAELRVGTAAPARVAAPEEGPLLLVVEDNLELNRFICESVAPELRSASAYNGAEGLRAARDLHPDLILTDVMMPVMSGDALIALLRSDPDLQTIPIVVLTAKADDGLRIRLLNAGARDCLTKPFSVEELRARLFNIANAKLGADRLMAANAGLQQAKAKAEAWLAAYERSEKVCARYQRGRVAANAAGGERLRLRRLLSVRAERGRARRRLVRCVAVARRRIVISMGDVGGSGLGAAIIMAALRQVIRGVAYVQPDPAMIVEAADGGVARRISGYVCVGVRRCHRSGRDDDAVRRCRPSAATAAPAGRCG